MKTFSFNSARHLVLAVVFLLTVYCSPVTAQNFPDDVRVRSGAQLPASCNAGDKSRVLFYKRGANAGLYKCKPETNTYVPENDFHESLLSAFPTPGRRGRIALATDGGDAGGIYFDNGFEWVKIGEEPSLYRHEGFFVIVRARTDQTEPAPAQSYGAVTQPLNITDLKPSTPLRVTPCDGSQLLNQASGSAAVQANQALFKWCFLAEDKLVQISYSDISGNVYVLRSVGGIKQRETGIFNVTDFGAVPNDGIDDGLAIRSALFAIASNNGGRLNFPEGEFQVGGEAGFQGLTIPPNTTITGAGSGVTGASTNTFPNNGSTRIKLTANNAAIFRIGEATINVAVRDMELQSAVTVGSPNVAPTYGIEAVGRFFTSYQFWITNVVFNDFARGIYAHDLANSNWQNDFWTVEKCTFQGTRDAGIYIQSSNSNWAVRDTWFLVADKVGTQNAADGIFVARTGYISVVNTFGASFNRIMDSFIDVLDAGGVYVQTSQCEGCINFLKWGDTPGAGSTSSQIVLVNNVIGRTVFSNRVNLISQGNLYVGQQILNADVRYWSFGDRFCYDGQSPFGCDPPDKDFTDADVNTLTDIINVPNHRYERTVEFKFKSGGTLPAPLEAGTTYYAIRVDANNVKVATSLANAEANIALDLTDNSGGGTHTLQSLKPTFSGGIAVFDSGQPLDNTVLARPTIFGNQTIFNALMSVSAGANIASASSITVTRNLHRVTGTTTITAINSTGVAAGTHITLIFDASLQVTDNNSTLDLNGNFAATANDVLVVVYDGTAFREVSRSVN